MPVAGSRGDVGGHHDRGAAEEPVRRGDHPGDADRDQPVQPALVGFHDQLDRVGPVGRRRPDAERLARHLSTQRPAHRIALGSRRRALAQRGEHLAVRRRQNGVTDSVSNAHEPSSPSRAVTLSTPSDRLALSADLSPGPHRDLTVTIHEQLFGTHNDRRSLADVACLSDHFSLSVIKAARTVWGNSGGSPNPNLTRRPRWSVRCPDRAIFAAATLSCTACRSRSQGVIDDPIDQISRAG